MQRQKILTLHHSSALECCPYAIAAEQKARVTYDNILRLQRFGEGLRLAKERLDQKNVYFLNPGFDSK